MLAGPDDAWVVERGDLVRPANTFDAHRLLHLAKERGVQEGLASRMTRAYLAEGELLSDHVRADEAEAARRDISAVPTLLMDERHVIPGAQSPESMLATLGRACRGRASDRAVEARGPFDYAQQLVGMSERNRPAAMRSDSLIVRYGAHVSARSSTVSPNLIA